MYFTEVDGIEYGIKPMNCLAHMLIYKSKVHSYRDLPKRYFELGTVLRHERSGVLHGLPARAPVHPGRRPHHLHPGTGSTRKSSGVLDFVDDVMKHVRISLRHGAFHPSGEIHRQRRGLGTGHQRADTGLEDKKLPYDVNEGDGAFYGPKIDVKLHDALNRTWQCATIQCDFTLPERFDLSYVGEDNQKHRPVMLHRVILGSLERFIGVLIEHYAGAFPTWLAPVQAILLSVTDRNIPFAEQLHHRLLQAGLRADKDTATKSWGSRSGKPNCRKSPTCW